MDQLLENLNIAYSKYSIDDYNEEEEYEEEEEDADDEEVNADQTGLKSDELACPFCFEDFDVLGLCCHVDADHRMEVKPGICPICTTKVRINMVSHVITQHESFLKALCNKKSSSARSRSAIFALRKELHEKHLRCIKETPAVDSYSDAASDSRLLSFVNNPEPSYKRQSVKAVSSSELSSSVDSVSENYPERAQPTTTMEKKNERARRCEFVQGLILSTILDDL